MKKSLHRSFFLSPSLKISEKEELGRFYCFDGQDEKVVVGGNNKKELILSSKLSSSVIIHQEIPVGMLLLKEKPFCFCVSEEQRSRICNYCFREKSEGMKLSRCKACKYSHYCSMECYVSDE